MEVTRKSRLRLRLQNIAFVALYSAVIGLLGWLSTRYDYQADWTAGARNTLSEASRRLLDTLEGPVTITAFARENELLRKRIQDLVDRYRRQKKDVRLRFVNPDKEPEQVRELGITMDGELLVRYQGRSEKVQQLTEQSLTNALQRLARGGQRWIVFLEGHGERNPRGRANHDLGEFGRELERKGLTVQTLNLAKTPAIPDNTTVLVIAGPRTKLLPGEVALIRDYVRGGGNLLWLADPGEQHGLEPLARDLGVSFLPGVIVDANTPLFGIRDPSFVLVADYKTYLPVTRDLTALTLFPRAAALAFEPPEGWHGEPFLTTFERAWTETGEIKGEIRFDEGTEERAGPLTLGVVLTRERSAPDGKTDAGGDDKQDTGKAAAASGAGEQRVAVVGDGDFLSNVYLGNGGNLDLGLALIHWLTHDDRFITIKAKTAPDRTLALSRTASAVIGFGFLFGLPLLLLGTGVYVWYRRGRR